MSTNVAKGLLQVQTQEGGWFYVKDRPEGFTYSIYSTNAIEASRFEEIQQQYPHLNFRVVTS